MNRLTKENRTALENFVRKNGRGKKKGPLAEEATAALGFVVTPRNLDTIKIPVAPPAPAIGKLAAERGGEWHEIATKRVHDVIAGLARERLHAKRHVVSSLTKLIETGIGKHSLEDLAAGTYGRPTIKITQDNVGKARPVWCVHAI